VTLDPAWRTSTVVALASQMYDSRDFSAMPILADALQDAGCDNPDMLNHCRSDGVHVRGCWVVDLALGKEGGVDRVRCGDRSGPPPAGTATAAPRPRRPAPRGGTGAPRRPAAPSSGGASAPRSRPGRTARPPPSSTPSRRTPRPPIGRAAPVDTDRNLLFGVLALQADLLGA